MMKPEKWLKLFIGIVACVLVAVMALMAWIDPFFHYHKPLPGFYYELSNERAQNDGIVRHFDYDAVITGTSLTQNFKAGEMDALFDCNSVKVCFSGATSKEMAVLMDAALSTHEVRYIVASASDFSGSFIQDKDYMQEMFDYPEYLYNNNLLDDVRYLLNRDVLVQYLLPMLVKKVSGAQGGITSFDVYSNWTASKPLRGMAAMGDMSAYRNDLEQAPLTPEEAEKTRANVEQNLVRIANENPDTTFYFFMPPYSVVAWGRFFSEGNALKYIEAEEIAAGLLTACENVKFFSFSLEEAIPFDLENYTDSSHYEEEVNSYMLEAMAKDDPRYRITKENAADYIAAMKELYLHYDYEALRDRR